MDNALKLTKCCNAYTSIVCHGKAATTTNNWCRTKRWVGHGMHSIKRSIQSTLTNCPSFLKFGMLTWRRERSKTRGAERTYSDQNNTV